MCIRDRDEGAAELLDTLHRAGYAAYVVGGCVRDSLLGLTPVSYTHLIPQTAAKINPNRCFSCNNAGILCLAGCRGLLPEARIFDRMQQISI